MVVIFLIFVEFRTFPLAMAIYALLAVNCDRSLSFEVQACRVSLGAYAKNLSENLYN